MAYLGNSPLHVRIGMRVFIDGCVWKVTEIDGSSIQLRIMPNGGVSWYSASSLDSSLYYKPAEDFTVYPRVECSVCKELFSERKAVYAEDRIVCPDCVDHTDVCVECRQRFFSENMFDVQGEMLCEHCYDEETVNCIHCEERIRRVNARHEEGYYWCEDCFYDTFTFCYECGTVVRHDYSYNVNDNDYCESCYDDLGVDTDGELHSYGYKPDPMFHDDQGRIDSPEDGVMYYGMELELEAPRGSREDVIKDIRDEYEDDYYLCEDGSLTNGIEVITHPRTFKSWENFWDSFEERVLKKARDYNCSAHDNGHCGIHIHTSLDEWDGAQLFRLFSIFYDQRNYKHLLKISQRAERQLKSYASLSIRDIGNEKDKAAIEDKKNPFGERYAALNITRNTLEFRLFNSNLRLERVKKNMEFVHAMYLYTKERKRVSWAGFLNWVKRHKKIVPNLLAFLKEKEMLTVDGDNVIRLAA